MSEARTQVRDAMAGSEGDSAEVRRLFPIHSFMNFDPFVLWDDFTIAPGAGFPDHPHRGFEGITYVIQGAVNHSDNLGNDSTVEAGGLQRFTAGRGIIHSEMPSPDTTTRGIQMWVNLPSNLKKLEPGYQQVDAQQIEQETIDGVLVRHLAGHGAALSLHTPVIYQDVDMPEGASYQPAIGQGMRGFIYLFEGAVSIDVPGAGDDASQVHEGQACFIENADRLDIRASRRTRMMLCFGMPHGQPIVQHGPFVD